MHKTPNTSVNGEMKWARCSQKRKYKGAISTQFLILTSHGEMEIKSTLEFTFPKSVWQSYDKHWWGCEQRELCYAASSNENQSAIMKLAWRFLNSITVDLL